MSQIVEEVPIELIDDSTGERTEFGDIDSLANSMLEKDLIQPITLDKHNILLAGRRRLRAAKKLLAMGNERWKTIPALRREVSGHLDALEIELYENIHRKDMTFVERSALEKKIYDLKVRQDPSWGVRQQAEMMQSSKSSVARNIELAKALEAVPELKNSKTADEALKKWESIKRELAKRVLGEKVRERKIYQWAEKHYKIGDAIEGMKQLQDGAFDFAEVDPPYGIDLDEQKTGGTVALKGYTEIPTEEYPKFIKDTAEQVYRLLNANSFCVWWFGPSWYSLIVGTLRRVGFAVAEIPAIWCRGNQGQTNNPGVHLASCYEPFIIARKGSPNLKQPGHSNVLHYGPVPAEKKIHPTQKPIDLYRTILDIFAPAGGTVLVPFAGSGITLLACYIHDMVGIGWDLHEDTKSKFLLMVDEHTADWHERAGPKEEPSIELEPYEEIVEEGPSVKELFSDVFDAGEDKNE